MKAFRINENTGFQVTFPNGVTLSTQFGAGSYGDNYNAPFPREATVKGAESDRVEIAAFVAPGGEWVTKEICAAAGLEDPSDDVVGYVVVGDWLKLVNACAAYVPATVAA